MDELALKNLKPLSHKARASIKSDGWITVWEGAIRSGKTVASLIAWFLYVSKSSERVFFMSGKTYGSLIRNCIEGDFGFVALGAPYVTFAKDKSGSTVLTIGEKKIYLFGATDDAAYMRIKGLTAGGWYADEVATHPESFIIEAMSRTAVSSDRRIFWTLNPSVPTHYIYSRFLDKWEGMRGYRRYHFTLEDNLAMTKERRNELASQYSGRFRMMYIFGLRCAAEGVIYENFDAGCIYSDGVALDGQISVACDYGTINPCVFLECCLNPDGVIYVSREYRWDARKQMQQKTDKQYVDDMREFIGEPESCAAQIIVDPSAASFFTALQMEGYFAIKGKNDVIGGIQRISSLFEQKRIKIHASCVGLISELQQYVWDEKAAIKGEEKPLKANDHAPDALRYYVNTALSVFDVESTGL